MRLLHVTQEIAVVEIHIGVLHGVEPDPGILNRHRVVTVRQPVVAARLVVESHVVGGAHVVGILDRTRQRILVAHVQVVLQRRAALGADVDDALTGASIENPRGGILQHTDRLDLVGREIVGERQPFVALHHTVDHDHVTRIADVGSVENTGSGGLKIAQPVIGIIGITEFVDIHLIHGADDIAAFEGHERHVHFIAFPGLIATGRKRDGAFVDVGSGNRHRFVSVGLDEHRLLRIRLYGKGSALITPGDGLAFVGIDEGPDDRLPLRPDDSRRERDLRRLLFPVLPLGRGRLEKARRQQKETCDYNLDLHNFSLKC